MPIVQDRFRLNAIRFKETPRPKHSSGDYDGKIHVEKLEGAVENAVFEGDGTWRDNKKDLGYMFAGAEYVPDGLVQDTRSWQILDWKQFTSPEVDRAEEIIRTPSQYSAAS